MSLIHWTVSSYRLQWYLWIYYHTSYWVYFRHDYVLLFGSEIQLEDKIRAEFLWQEKLWPSSTQVWMVTLHIKISFVLNPYIKKRLEMFFFVVQSLCYYKSILRLTTLVLVSNMMLRSPSDFLFRYKKMIKKQVVQKQYSMKDWLSNFLLFSTFSMILLSFLTSWPSKIIPSQMEV